MYTNLAARPKQGTIDLAALADHFTNDFFREQQGTRARDESNGSWKYLLTGGKRLCIWMLIHIGHSITMGRLVDRRILLVEDGR